MGFFSWNTADTNKSIMNTNTGRATVCTVLWSDGERWEDVTTDGYGRFGGKDIYQVMADKNGLEGRAAALDVVFQNGNMDFTGAAAKGYIVPKFVSDKTLKYEDVGFSPGARGQGFFYADEEDEQSDTQNH